ncbi:MAG TPA: sigma 54-interacting transcriptional regulator, partial [Polyangium sp.]|nr:sigma 54-interacting transcriptional regulator [Polyangium sp.]
DLDGRFRRFPLGVRKVGQIAATGRPLWITDINANSQWIAIPEWAKSEGITSFAGHPLIFRGQVLGVLGAFSRKPFRDADIERLENLANHAAIALVNARAFEEIEALRARLEAENTYLRAEVSSAFLRNDIIGESPALQRVMEQVQLVAATNATVLITGESGTGKELVARAIHEHSARKDRILVKLNCGAIPETLFESEFFGHMRGAFTGALKDRPGRFELADGGTLFLDEIGEIPLAMQAKLLRVLQEQELERIGDTRTRKINVRIIAATNRELGKEVEAGRFRQDLFYRLGVVPLHIPPLRERRDDVPLLVGHFLQHCMQRMNRRVPPVDPALMNQLMAYDWPGNVRELQNLVERAVILWNGGALQFDLPSSKPMPPQRESAPMATRDDLKRLEKEGILAALEKSGGKVFGAGGAAELLGMKPTTLASRMASLGIQRKSKR